MSHSYGKIAGSSHKRGAKPPAEIQINIPGRHMLEQLSLELQRAIERLNVRGIFGVERFRVRLMPLDQAGGPMTVCDDNGQQVLTINIPDQPLEKPYRDNEPGLGVAPGEPGTSSRRRSPPHL